MLAGPCAAKNVVRLCPDFAIERFGRHDGGREHAYSRKARAWIHDVTIKPTLSPKKLFVVSGSRERVVAQINFRRSLLFVLRIADTHAPSARLIGRRSQTVNAAAAARNQSAGNSVFFQDADHLIYRVSFAHAAGIEPDSRVCEVHGAGGWIEPHIPISDMAQRGRDFR